MDKIKNYAIILASGTGSRYGNDIPKQFVKIAGKTILEHTIEIFEKSAEIDEIVVVITPGYNDFTQNIIAKNNYKKIFKVTDGGQTRKESSSIGLSVIPDEEANVIIHDAARPFLSQKIISDCVKALGKFDAVDVAIPSADTIIEVNDNVITKIPDRANLRRGQTPQCFKLSVIKKAHELSKNDNNFTDDCGLVIKNNLAEVFVVEGDIDNMKITYNSDIYMADRLFQLKNTSFSAINSFENLKDKVIVIFGGTSGIGKAICKMAEENDAVVFVTSLSKGCDVSKYDEVENYMEEIYQKTGKIDYVINCAGTLKIAKFQDRSIEDIKNDIDVNLTGNINVIKSSIEYLKETKGAFLLFTSSSYTRGRAMYSVYSATKAAVVNLVQALSEEFYEDKVRINVINPQRTATPMRFEAFGKEPKETLLSPDEVAKVSLHTLLTNLTGQIIDVRKTK